MTSADELESHRVELITRDGVAEIVLDAAERRNAIDLPAAQQFEAAASEVTRLAETGGVRVVVVRASGRHFCVGGDLRSFEAAGDGVGDLLRRITGHLHNGIQLLDALTIPVVTVAQGAIAGAGIGLAFLGDIVVLADNASVRLAYTAVGLSPDGGTSYLLPRVLGQRLATALMLTNDDLSAQRAFELGLASQVVSLAELGERVEAIVASVAALSVNAVAATKRLTRRSLSSSLEDQLAAESESISLLGAGEVSRELVRAFTKR